MFRENKNQCFNCGKDGKNLHGYIICDDCKNSLRLFTDKTVKKYMAQYEADKDKTYKEEIKYRLDFIDKDHIKKKIKLLDILEKIVGIDNG